MFGTDLNAFERGLFLKPDALRNSLSSNCRLYVMMMTMVEVGVARNVNYSNSNSKDNNNTLMRIKQNT
jgi:hypothetical protein